MGHQIWVPCSKGTVSATRVKKTVFLKRAQPSVFLGVLLGFGVLLAFFGQAGKMGKIIQKLSNLKP